MPFIFEGWGFEINFDGIFIILCILIFVDWGFGVALSFAKKETSSSTMYAGILKKTGEILLVIIVDIVGDLIMHDGGALRYGLIIMLIINEFASFLEHLKKSGVKVPPAIEKILDHLKAETEKPPNDISKEPPEEKKEKKDDKKDDKKK